jgi:hypothetical protein
MLNFIEDSMSGKLKYLLLIIISFTLLHSCVKKKVYSDTPEIGFKHFDMDTGITADLTITFSDGNGDIGKENNDPSLNFYANYYYKDTLTQKFVALWVGTDSLKNGYTVHKPNDEYNGKPISGDITVHMPQYRHSKKIKTFRYVLYLFDNAGHKSNVVVTPDLTGP